MTLFARGTPKASLRWDLSPDERHRLQEESGPVRRLEVIGLLVRHPSLIPDAIRDALRGANEGLRNSPELQWLVQIQRTRRVVPDAAIGTNWHGESDFVDHLLSKTHSDERALEIGCGGGRISRHIAPHVRELICADVSELILREARATLAGCDNVGFARVTGLGLRNFDDASFDLVFAHDVLINFDPNQALATLEAARRVLRGGGRCVTSYYTIDRPAWALEQVELVRKAGRSNRFGATLPRPYTSEQIDAWHTAVGMSVIDHCYGDQTGSDLRAHYIVTGQVPDSPA